MSMICRRTINHLIKLSFQIREYRGTSAVFYVSLIFCKDFPFLFNHDLYSYVDPVQHLSGGTRCDIDVIVKLFSVLLKGN